MVRRSLQRAHSLSHGDAQVELWDVRGPVPAVRSVALTPDGAAPTAVDLGDALPLSALLAPVGAAKEQIAAALDLLEPAQPGARLLGSCVRWRCRAGEQASGVHALIGVSLIPCTEQCHLQKSSFSM